MLLHAIPNVRPDGQPQATKGSDSDDKAYALIGGLWTCRTLAGTPITHRFRRDVDGISIVVETTVKTNGRTEHLPEEYKFHESSMKWTVSLAGGSFIAKADPWTSTTWKFVGIYTEGETATDATMTYVRADRDDITRTFARDVGKSSIPFSGEHCIRISNQ